MKIINGQTLFLFYDYLTIWTFETLIYKIVQFKNRNLFLRFSEYTRKRRKNDKSLSASMLIFTIGNIEIHEKVKKKGDDGKIYYC